MINRSQMLGYGPALGAAGMALPLVAAVTAEAHTTPAVRVPTLQFVYECNLTSAPAQDFGPTVEGRRRVIPITGGSFEGPRMRGQVVNEGADWNLSRNDGASSVDADYYLRTDDGVTIRVVNKGVGVGAC